MLTFKTFIPSLPTHAGSTYKSTTTNQTISCSGKKMTSNIIIQGDSNLKAENIKKGISILGVAGSLISGGGNITKLQTIQGYRDKYLDDSYNVSTVVLNFSTSMNIVAIWYYYNSRSAFDYGVAYNLQGNLTIQMNGYRNYVKGSSWYMNSCYVSNNGAVLLSTFDAATSYYGLILGN